MEDLRTAQLLSLGRFCDWNLPPGRERHTDRIQPRMNADMKTELEFAAKSSYPRLSALIRG
jgi:hypothetical protein